MSSIKQKTHNKGDWEIHAEHFGSGRWSEPCPCGACVKERAIHEKKERMRNSLVGAQEAQKTVAAFEDEFGPIEGFACGDKEFHTERGKTRLRSQKARGVAAGRDYWGGCYSHPDYLSPEKILAMLPQHGKNLALTYPVFARPCPTRPRHGFVESRIVNDEKELLALLCETLQADPSGEVMIMRPLTGRASAVATDSGVVWGKGNDGVTAGSGEQFLCPVPKPEKTFTERIREESRDVLAKDLRGSAYVECVEHGGKVRIVQMRDGPADVPVGGNYVPEKDYKVENIIALGVTEQPDVDLLEWEKRILAAPKGTAVHLPCSSLTSHLAVHALAKKFAVITETTGPHVGQVLQPSDDQPASLTKADYATMGKMVKRKLPHGRKSRAGFAIGVLHAQSAWDNSPHLLWARVAGATMMARLLVSACVGEARHYYSAGPGAYSSKAKPATPWKKIIGRELSKERRAGDIERSSVLEKVYRYSIASLRSLSEAARKDFSGYWGVDEEDGACGYGGPKWKNSARIATALCDAILAFERTPTEKRWSKVMMAYNKGVAAAHNGGHLLDKWADWSEIDLCANAPQWGLLSPQMMFICAGVKPTASDSSYDIFGFKEAGIVAKKPTIDELMKESAKSAGKKTKIAKTKGAYKGVGGSKPKGDWKPYKYWTNKNTNCAQISKVKPAGAGWKVVPPQYDPVEAAQIAGKC